MTYLRRMLTVTSITVASIGLLVIAGSGTAQAQGAANGIVNSPHDFTDNVVKPYSSAPGVIDEFTDGATPTGWNVRGEICRTCHVPHDHNRAAQYYTNGLLWNHEVTSAAYTMYDAAWSSTIDGATVTGPDGISKLCLGCHDGTVAVDTFDKVAAGSIYISAYDAGFQVPGAVAAGDLTGTHPLSIVYDDAADSGLHNPASTAMGTSGFIDDVLDGGKVQCSSCHDVHDSPTEAVAGTHLLRVANNVAGGNPSGLCLTCHNK